MNQSKHNDLNRRSLIQKSGLALGGLAAASMVPFRFGLAVEETAQLTLDTLNGKKILFFNKSAGFEHSVVRREGDAPSYAERFMTNFAAKYGFTVKNTKDGRVFDSEYQDYDAYFFYTTGDLCSTSVKNVDREPAMSEKGKDNLLSSISAGKGFAGSHCASDTFHSKGANWENQSQPDPYIQMIGGEFSGHGSQQPATMKVIDMKFPGIGAVGDSYSMTEEWYSLKNFAPDMHVILLQDTNGMENFDYQRPPYPATWARKHDEGRVFYTSMGHREDVWTNPIFESILMGGLAYVTSAIKHDVPPNLEAAAPEAAKLPVK